MCKLCSKRCSTSEDNVEQILELLEDDDEEEEDETPEEHAAWKARHERTIEHAPASGSSTTKRRSRQANRPSSRAVLPAPLVERDRAGGGDVQRLAPRSESALPGRARPRSAAPPARRRAGRRLRRRDRTLPSGSPPCATSATRFPARLVEREQGHAPDRAGRGAQRLRAGRVGAALRERDGGTERVGGADQRADVPGIGDPPERQRHRPRLGRRQVVAPVDADHARRMGRGRDLGEQLRLDVLARNEQLDRLGGRRLDEILALADEQPELVAPAPLVQLADELQLLVVAGA